MSTNFRGVRVKSAMSNALNVTVVMGDTQYTVRDVGIGHPPHTIITKKGDTPKGSQSTSAEVALAEALAKVAAGE